jgi:hypothetical protein
MVHISDDWRLHGQEKYLSGVPLTLKKYTKWSETWDHDHCEFCMAKFMEEPGADILLRDMRHLIITIGFVRPVLKILKPCFIGALVIR